MHGLPSFTTSARSVYPTYPPSSLLTFDLPQNPPAISPPYSEPSLSHPFNINPDVYNSMLHVAWPITIALVYSITVTRVNRVNADRNHKPWPVSQTTAFYVFVVAHNVLLALYSAWTFAGMIRAIRHSWPGLKNDHGLAGVADALCKLHGPRGPGSAATYNTASGAWHISDISMRLEGGMPDSTDVGRIWNEGLSYYGWIFYLSKFYEVLDTAIILTKGKKTSFLQTYHHTGAMFAMWAGIRYMSPPIWMFTCVNSFVHIIMYSYYSACALTIRVPPVFKRALTSMQIAQIIFGISYAVAHLFVAYDVPYWASYRVMNNLSTALPSAAATATSAFSSISASADFAGWLKKAALRAAGEEGLAENVRNHNGEPFGIDAIHSMQSEKSQEELIYKLSMTKTHCLDTSGEVFAIALNFLYLAPLTYLFIDFFRRGFIKASRAEPRKNKAEVAKHSADQAVKDVKKEIEEAMSDEQGSTAEPPEELKVKLESAKEDARKAAVDLGDAAKEKSRDARQSVQSDLEALRNRAKQGATDANAKDQDATPDVPAKPQQRKEDPDETPSKAAGGDDSKAPEEEQDQADKGKNNIKQEGADSADPSAYEVNPDLPKTSDEKKAEEKMQPNGVS